MKVSVLIADDEPIAREGLRSLVDSVDWAHVVAEAANGPAAVELINARKPDVAFLDIRMPGLSGIDVLRQIVHRPHIVFTTAYSEHAVTAFELGALDYLLKPFGADRFAAAMDRVRAALGEPAPTTDRIAEALATGPMSRLFVRSGASIVPVAVAGVRWFEALGDYVAAHAASRYMLHVSLAKLETRLDPVKFVRVHRGAIVNLDHVKAFKRTGGRLVAELTDGTHVAVSRSKAQELRALGA